jgi:hypothetical protein
MAMTLSILIANPDAHHVPAGHVAWLISGLGSVDGSLLERRLAAGDTVAEDICRELGDASVVKIEYSESRAAQVTAWRGITSGFDVFYAVRPSGDVIVADHFRNIVSRLPPGGTDSVRREQS